MKKKFVCSVLFMIVLLVFALSSASGAERQNAENTSAHSVISPTGAAYEDLGASFYARIGMTDPKKYFTVPNNVMNTTELKEYVENSTQYWHFTRQSDGSYKIRNVYKNLYLELYNGTYPKENNELIHAEADNLADQRWRIKKAGAYYQFVTCANTSFLLKGVNLYTTGAEIRITNDFSKENTHFTISKIAMTSDYLATPAVKLSCASGGVSVSWNKIAKATSYRVYRYNTTKKKWISLVKTTGTSYLDKSVSSGTTYQYMVKCETPLPSKYVAKSIKYLAAPTVSVTNTVSGPVISWKKVNGAQAYRVFYKTTGSWVSLGTTKSTSLTHSKVSYNVNYSYTVRCVSANGKTYTSAFNTAGVKNRIVRTPKVKVSLNPNGYQISWNKITGAHRYIVLIRSKATNWKWAKPTECIKNQYFYSGPISNQAYYFTVRCIDEKHHYISGFTSTAKMTYYAAPKLKSLKTTSSTVTLSWNKISGAAKYAIYSWNGKAWVRRAVTTAASIKMKVVGSAKQNKCFSVRCLNKSGKTISSYYESIYSGGKILYYHPGAYTSKNKF